MTHAAKINNSTRGKMLEKEEKSTTNNKLARRRDRNIAREDTNIWEST